MRPWRPRGAFPGEQSAYANRVLQALPLRDTQQRLGGFRRGRITRPDAEGFLSSLPALNIHLTDPTSYGEVFEAADRTGLTVYGAAYLEPVTRIGAEFASLDDALRKPASVGVVLCEPG